MSSGAGGALFYAHLFESAKREAVDEADRNAWMLARQTSLHLDRVGKSAATLAGLSQMREALRDGASAVERAEAVAVERANAVAVERADAVLDRYCAVLGASICYLMDAKGTVVTSSNRGTAASLVGKVYAFRPYFKDALAGRDAIYMALGVTTGERGIYYACPVTDENGAVLGVTVIKTGVEAIEGEFHGLSGSIALSDGDGIVFASNRPDWLFRSLRRLPLADAERIRTSRQYGDKMIETVGLREIAPHLAEAPDGTVHVVGRQALETPRDWHISYLLDNRTVAPELRGGEYWLAYGFGVVFALTGLAVVALYRSGNKDIERRREVEGALERRIELESLLAGISSDFISADAGEFQTKVVHTLMALGQFTETDRVVLFARSQGGKRLSLEAEWSVSGVASRLPQPPSYDDGDLWWLVSQLTALRTVHVPTLSGLPPEAEGIRAIWGALGVRSSLSVPLVLRGKFAGFVGFHAIRGERSWSEEDIRMLATAAEILSFALDRERTEAQLRKLSLAIEQSPVSVVMTDRKGTIEFANAQFGVVSGYPPAEAIGRNPRILKSGRTPVETYQDLWRTITSGKLWRGELLNRRKSGELYWEAVVISPLMDRDGAITHFIGIKEDITELKRVALELERSNAELEQFCYAISHDLQQPLRMVTSYVQLLDAQYGKALDGMAKSYIGFAVDGGRRMQRMIRDLLEYSRVKTKGEEPVPCDSGVALRDALANLTVAIRDAGAEVTAPDMPVVIADMGQLERLFQNLIGNAVKYHAPERPPRVVISTERLGSDWVFAIRDNGIGIDRASFDRVFELFQRLHTRDAYDGTGVGLALCRRIVEHHGGRIWLESEPDQGSTFFFTLPAADAALR